MPIKLTKAYLQKADYTCILVSLAHQAPPDLYKKVQEEIDVAQVSGHKIFYEGIETYPPREPSNPEARKVLNMLSGVLNKCWDKPLKEGHVQEKGSYQLPQDAVCADVHISELADFCAQHRLFEEMTPQQILECLNGTCKDPKLHEKMDIVFLGRHNLHAAVEVSKHRGNSLLLYGQAHVYGLIRWMELDGWKHQGSKPYYVLK